MRGKKEEKSSRKIWNLSSKLLEKQEAKQIVRKRMRFLKLIGKLILLDKQGTFLFLVTAAEEH